ncbi:MULTISPECIES: GNAT family N-acetyltransferase [unclassified Streptomyces]|uniref:GNAT family N-acetyltransferase n=1 Tax=unclassified Streptomyces TaxID=2593676 RepID=UPI00247686FA|nr:MULTISPECIES: GNAT family N-acetyltransferase [unclassified Streptomyces]MDH6448835.1 GNAT superfamily N-acetyltransferase [Streptomyces sp. SAI-119]MDH6500584.1 GNAT superfamily N-acetyltransferase [Streptomyces sp. SAI-149]
MTVIVRDLRPQDPADVESFAHVRHLALPFMLWTPAGVLHRLVHTHPDAHYRSLVAEEDGEVIGTAQIGLAEDSQEPGHGYLNIYVRPDRTRRGAGDLLVRTAEEHLAAHGATKLYSWVLDEPQNRAFAERHGYRPTRPAHFLRLDLTMATLPPLQSPPPGVELRTAADFADDPRPFYELDAETTVDEPSDGDATFTGYETWIEENWKHPLLDRALTTIALVDGRPAAFSAVHTDGAGRYATAMTGTARAFRGRGLAKLAKNASLHRARAAGFTEALTGNDATNEPMLAINKWFGYEIRATEVRHVRELT